jgi:ubiquinone/menaquinone biosynthesis C-methylase UbiE
MEFKRGGARARRGPQRAASLGATASASGAAHSLQNFAPSWFSIPQRAQITPSESRSLLSRHKGPRQLDSRRQMDVTEFKRASHAVWETMAQGWEDRHAYFEERARPVAERMIERLAPTTGQTILELAAGTGVVGFAAAALVGSDGRVIVSDFSQAMVEAATRRAAELGLVNIECRVLDAEEIDLPDEAVDGVLCRWGYMLMADPEAALKESRRVLRRGGRLSCAVFGAPEQNPWVALPSAVLHERGHMPESGAPGILALADRNRLRNLFAQAGFSEPQIEEVAFTWRFRDVDDYWAFLTGAAGAIAAVVDRLEEDERGPVREELAERLQPFYAGDEIELPAVSLVAWAG